MSDEIIIDGRGKRGRGRQPLSRDRVLTDGREVEFVKSGWGEKLDPITGATKVKMEVLVRIKDTGQLERVWYTQLRPLTKKTPANTLAPQHDNRQDVAGPKKLADIEPEFAWRYNGIVAFRLAIRPTFGRVIQQYDPAEPEFRSAVSIADGLTVQVPVHYYRVRKADGIVDTVPDYLLEPVAGPECTWLWREKMPMTVLQKKVYELELRIRGKVLVLPPEEASLLNVKTRSQPLVKRPLTNDEAHKRLDDTREEAK